MENQSKVLSERTALPNGEGKAHPSIEVTTASQVTSIPPNRWPQHPILLAPSPGSGTSVKTVRFVSSLEEDEFLTDKSRSKVWWHELEKQWNKSLHDKDLSIDDDCIILPVNNGNEPHGKSLVVDFETSLFEGTLQVRIRETNGTTSKKYDDRYGFFSGREAKYQCVVSGRFKKEGIPIEECVTGQLFSRPLKTPPAYITKSAIKLVSIFAPRLKADLDRDKPFVLSPLGSTPQTIHVNEIDETMICSKGVFRAKESIMNIQEEPFHVERKLQNLRNKSSLSSTSVSRLKQGKKTFDKLCDKEDKDVFQTDLVYTFEFLQHLFDYSSMELNLGGFLGKRKLKNMLNDQPLRIMAAHSKQREDTNYDLKYLWSFDIWHESVLPKEK